MELVNITLAFEDADAKNPCPAAIVAPGATPPDIAAVLVVLVLIA